MKRILFAACVLATVQLSYPATKVDSILDVTTNLHARFAWIRWPWADSAYKPLLSRQNKDSNTQLIVYSTREGKERILDPQIGNHHMARITRKGTHVIWFDKLSNCTWIQEFSGATPRRKLLGSGYQVGCVHLNPATGAESFFARGNGNKAVYRFSFTPDYLTDSSAKATVFTTSNQNGIDEVLSVSEDLKYMGAAVPWPQTYIIDLSTKNMMGRHNPVSAFGCNACIAPDNSYRFYHQNDDHRGIFMFGENLATTTWTVPLNQSLPFNNLSAPDCGAPRWSNHPRFIGINYPMDGYEVNWNLSDFFRLTAAQVRTENHNKTPQVCVGRFSADFKSVEKWVRVSAEDNRYADFEMESWIELTTSTRDARPFLGPQSYTSTYAVNGSTIEAFYAPGNPGVLSVLDIAGRLVAGARGDGRLVVSLLGLPAGTYFIRSASTAGRALSPVFRLNLEPQGR